MKEKGNKTSHPRRGFAQSEINASLKIILLLIICKIYSEYLIILRVRQFKRTTHWILLVLLLIDETANLIELNFQLTFQEMLRKWIFFRIQIQTPVVNK